MAEDNKCPHCGKPVPTGAPGGLCPECMVKVGIGSEAATAGGGPKRPAPAPPSPQALARLFPQLEIIELLGSGGMGAVYKARQREIDRLVALKILPSEAGDDPGFAERFTREARALAKLSHPNIVALHDFGHVNGLHYFVMEFVDGLNLRQLEQAGRLSPREALQIIPQICDALQFAHDEGIVHRDIKPENVLLDKKGRVKIADFGLARILCHEPENLRLTRAREVMGTPHYMAPEQVEKPQSVDHRADIFSLGVVFYEMLTGELPLGKFAPPSQKVQIDVRLDEVVLRALEKEPARRYQQAGEVKTDMETILTQPPASAGGRNVPRPGIRTPEERITRMKRLIIYGAAAVVMAALAGILWEGKRLAAARDARQAAVRAAEQAAAMKPDTLTNLAAEVPSERVAEYKNIGTRLDALTRQQQELLLQYQPSHPLVQDVRTRIEKLAKTKQQLETGYPGLLAVNASDVASPPTPSPGTNADAAQAPSEAFARRYGLDRSAPTQVAVPSFAAGVATNRSVAPKPGERWYEVSGEVRSPGRQVYNSRITVLQAIALAGGFTDFADKKKVLLTHRRGRSEVVNCAKALDDPSLDLGLQPGDTLLVQRQAEADVGPTAPYVGTEADSAQAAREAFARRYGLEAPAALAATNAIGPRIQFGSLVHDFGRVRSGEQVKYSYVFTNAGDQSLELNVSPACGCITADWTREVEPGKTGVIPIAFNTAGYAGPILKSIAVYCNDRTNPRPVLQFKGTVWKSVDVVPAIAVLNLSTDAPPASVTVRLTNNLPEPITLSAPESNNRALAAELKTLRPGKEFQVVVTPVSPLTPGTVQALITLKTSSTNTPIITIPAVATMHPVGTNNPARGALPPAWPLGTDIASTVPGPEGLVLTRLTPLYLKVSLEGVPPSERGPFYVIGIQKEAALNFRDRSKSQRYCRLGDKNETFALRDVKAPPDNPTNITVLLELNDTGQHVEVSCNHPFQRLEGYTADLQYGPERRIWARKRVGEGLAIGGDEYQIIAITQTSVVLWQKSNNKTWAVEYAEAPER